MVPALKLYVPPPDPGLIRPHGDYVTGPTLLARELLESTDTLEALNAHLMREYVTGQPILPGLRNEITELWVWLVHRTGWAYFVCQGLAAEDGDNHAWKQADLNRQLCAFLKAKVIAVLRHELPTDRILGHFGTPLDQAPIRLGDYFGVPAEVHRRYALSNLRRVVRDVNGILEARDPFPGLELSWMRGWGVPEEDPQYYPKAPADPLHCATM
jgi:hypothetical protein